MKTQYGDIPDNLTTNYHRIKRVGELVKILDQLPDDLPIGYNKFFGIKVSNAPSAPILEFGPEKEEASNDEPF